MKDISLFVFLRSHHLDPLALSPSHVDSLIRDGHVSLEQADAILREFLPHVWRKDPYCGESVKTAPPFPDEEEEEEETDWDRYHAWLLARWNEHACLAA